MRDGVLKSGISGTYKFLGCIVGIILAATAGTSRSTCIEGSGSTLFQGSGVLLCKNCKCRPYFCAIALLLIGWLT
eukprot:12889818-Prorocentrum_lima.AAC.1